MKLQIRYRSNNDEITDRIISDIDLDPPHRIHAFCHLRNEGRTFALSRIESAIDIDSGEAIADISLFFGLESLKPPRPTMPIFSEKPKPMSTEDAQRQRKADKQLLFQRFAIPVIKEIFKDKLYNLFERQCFKCTSQNKLEIDHHIPQYLGGRLWPGNLVILCARCNSTKGDKHPKQFYSAEQLQHINDILEKELDIFDFKINWSKWEKDRKEYLLLLESDGIFVNEVLTNQEHPFYVDPREYNEEATSICIEIDLSNLKAFGK